MDARTWAWAKELLADVVDLPAADQRAYIEQHCADPSLRRDLLALLESPAPVSDVVAGVAMLSPGARLGPYEIVGVLGVGGMGEVYRAHDTRLHRDVAVKVLPLPFAADPLRLSMLDREARTLAALNHPGIAQIHGLEESSAGRALILELVDGPTLAERIDRQPIPIDEALTIACQFADALEAAHEQGIVHRDLKPANIKLRDDGTVKLLDFGLAKALDGFGGAPAASTSMGLIVGTAAYMSPEQASGKAIDRRTDIWAFGCVLYEMLTGRRAFPGDDVSAVRASVLTDEPDWRALPAGLSSSVRVCLMRCLTKDVRRRVQAIGDVRLLLDGLFESKTTDAAPRWRPAAVAVVGLAFLAVGLTGWAARWTGAASAARERRFAISVPAPIPFPFGTLVALSPDGQVLVYRSVEHGIAGLYKRRLDLVEMTAIPGTDGVAGDAAFFSPDGRWLGFVIASRLWKVPTGGGQPQVVADLSTPVVGAAWGTDDFIVCGTVRRGRLRVRASGGGVEVIAPQADTRPLWYPHFLPGGRGVLFSSEEVDTKNGDVMVLDLGTRAQRRIVNGVDGQYLPTGHLIFIRDNKLWAVRFDLTRLKMVGDPIAIEHDVFVHPGGRVQLAVSTDGTLTYVARPAGYMRRALVWVDRGSGREEPIGLPSRLYRMFKLSPDGTRIVVEILENENDLWMWDLSRPSLQRLTHDEGRAPAWSPDGTKIAYSSGGNIYTRAADGSGNRTLVTHNLTQSIFALGFTPSGKQLLATEYWPGGVHHISLLDVNPGAAPRRLSSSPFDERAAFVSPNGQWLAYTSNESDTGEVYVRPFAAGAGPKLRISSGGGSQPRWRADGRELFYRGYDGSIVAVPVVNARTFAIDRAAVALRAPYAAGEYEVSPDGRRFLVMKDLDDEKSTPPLQIVVVLNWFEKLKQAFASH